MEQENCPLCGNKRFDKDERCPGCNLKYNQIEPLFQVDETLRQLFKERKYEPSREYAAATLILTVNILAWINLRKYIDVWYMILGGLASIPIIKLLVFLYDKTFLRYKRKKYKKKVHEFLMRCQNRIESLADTAGSPQNNCVIRKQCDVEILFAKGLDNYCFLKDYTNAFQCFKQAAELGNATSQYVLAVCYAEGEGVTQNDAEAEVWFRKAADQGDGDAMEALRSYEQDRGDRQDCTENGEWYQTTTEQSNDGFAEAKQQTMPQMNPNIQPHSSAARWWPLALKGEAEAQYKLALCYSDGDGVVQSYRKAVKWFRKAADQGHADAQVNLGYCYENGMGIKRDYAEATKLYRSAAEQGNPYGCNNLGYCYEIGRGVAKNYAKAVECFRYAAEQGVDIAWCNLGDCYAYGTGVPQSFREAKKCWTKAAEHGHEGAKKKLESLKARRLRNLRPASIYLYNSQCWLFE